MGSQKFRNVGKSQWVLIMIDPIISTCTRSSAGDLCSAVCFPGYGGFHQTWTSRSPLSGNVSIGLNRAVGSSYADEGPLSGPWFFSTIIKVVDGPILYNASTGVIACARKKRSGGSDHSSAVPLVSCPGMDVDAASKLGITCTVQCAATMAADVLRAPCSFPEIVTMQIPSGGKLTGNANGNL
jgi:hypothetical protein